MEIKFTKDRETVPLSKIPVGECFRYPVSGSVGMRLQGDFNGDIPVVVLYSGLVEHLYPAVRVEPTEARVVVGPAPALAVGPLASEDRIYRTTVRIVEDLDDAARDVDTDSFGLPRNETSRHKLRKIVERIIIDELFPLANGTPR